MKTNVTLFAALLISSITFLFTPSSAQKIAAGADFSFTLCGDSTAQAWGDNSSETLGDGSFSPSSIPVQVSTLTGVTAIASREFHTVAVLSNGEVWNWGDTVLFSPTPTKVIGITSPVTVAAGGSHFLAIKSDSTVWAWDRN